MSTAGRTNQVVAVAAGAKTEPCAQVIGRWRYPQALTVLFLLSLPIVNPWVRGDGVGYYAYVRSVLIDRDLRFDNEWLAGNPSFLQSRIDATGHLSADQYSRTGYVKNHFSVGPSILWAPFLVAVHGMVLGADQLGAHVPANGYSRPYLVTAGVATALYGFMGLLLAFDLARRYFQERWAFLATLGIWGASSLPVYMYFNPFWSHAHSAFSVSLFLWYWHRTRSHRRLRQWLLLGLSAGLMMNVYYPNAILLLVPAVEALADYHDAFLSGTRRSMAMARLVGAHTFFILIVCLSLLPTFVVRRIIYGNAFETDYPSLKNWFWDSPVLLRVLFSADHGMLVWTPILIPAILGLILFRQYDRLFGTGLLLSFCAFFYFIASYPDWNGISSFGNRFFISLTPLFILGLAAFLDFFAREWRNGRSDMAVAASAIGLLILWNAGFVFQWGTGMLPARGTISWREMMTNQYAVVPQRIGSGLKTYFLRRKTMMQGIERQDLQRLHPRSGQ